MRSVASASGHSSVSGFLGDVGMAPQPITAALLEPLYPAVGEFIVNWSIFNSQIVKIVAAIYHAAGGKHHADKKMPFEFGRRARFLRKCIKQIDALAPFAEDIEKILTEAKELQVLRDAIIHGAVSTYDSETERYSFVKLDIDQSDDMHVANSINTGLADIRGAVVDTQSAMTLAILLSKRIFDTFLRQDPID